MHWRYPIPWACHYLGRLDFANHSTSYLKFNFQHGRYQSYYCCPWFLVTCWPRFHRANFGPLLLQERLGLDMDKASVSADSASHCCCLGVAWPSSWLAIGLICDAEEDSCRLWQWLKSANYRSTALPKHGTCRSLHERWGPVWSQSWSLTLQSCFWR